MTEIRIDPVIPVGAIALLIVIAAIGMWVTFRRCLLPVRHRLGLMAIRLAGIFILGALLLQPQLLRIRTDEENPTLAVLLDTSASMQDSPNQNPNTRTESVRDFLASPEFRKGTGRYRLKWFQFAAELEDATDPEERGAPVCNGPRSHIAQAINSLVQRCRGENLAGIIVLTDGLDQSTRNLLPEAAQVPLFIPELEIVEKQVRQEGGDIFIAEVTHPSMLVVNWKGQVGIVIKRNDGGSRVTCPVQLFRGTELERSGTVIFEPDDTVKTLNFSIEPPTVGRLSYRVEIQPGSDRRKDNNTRQFAIDVTDPKNRILYLEGTPRWEFKYVKRALLKEKNYQVSAFVQSGPGLFINFSEGTQAAQITDMPELSDATTLKFRALILGEMSASAMTAAQQETVVKYVEKGGGLLLLGSSRAYGKDGWPDSDVMSKLLPFANEGEAKMIDGRFSLTPTANARNHPILAGLEVPGGFPEILSVWRRVRQKPDATVLLETADNSPVLIVKRYGKGKVVAVLTESLWRWQLGEAQVDAGKSLYEQFISQIIYWLSPQQKELDDSTNLQVITASAQAEVREHVSVGAVSGEGGAKLNLVCQITTPDKRTLSFDMLPAKLGQEVGLVDPVWGWRTEFVPHLPGEYEIAVREKSTGAQAQTKLLVIEPQLEKTGKPIDRKFLKQLARRTGGKFYAADELGQLMKDVPHETLKVTSTSQRPIWNKVWILLVLIAIFAGEWFLRSKLDLV